ncbi:MAG: MerR family transcriptional regulator [Marmoricola sp.]|nr:MerR family transcriptional regulator [Marmoricola sp.]
MKKSAQPLFAISVAAELAGTTIASLRAYERQGLLEPARTDGGTRRYSQDNVETLLRVRSLLDAGLNLAGVEKVLRLEDEVARLTSRTTAEDQTSDAPQV